MNPTCEPTIGATIATLPADGVMVVVDDHGIRHVIDAQVEGLAHPRVGQRVHLHRLDGELVAALAR